MPLIFRESVRRRGLDLLVGDVTEGLMQTFVRPVEEIPRPVQANVVVNEADVLELGAVAAEDLGVVGDDRAVVVVVAEVLVEVVGHAGVEYGVNAHFHERLYVPVRQLGREADSIAGNCRLPFQVERPAGHRTVINCKAELCKKRIPEGVELPHIEAERYAYFRPAALHGLVGEYEPALIFIEVELAGIGPAGHRPLAAVAAYVGLPVGEGVDS